MARARRSIVSSLPSCSVPLGVTRIQQEWWHPGQSVTFIRRHNHVVLWILTGSGRATLDGREHPLVAGTALVLAPSVPHELVSDHPPLEVLRLVVSGPEVGRELRQRLGSLAAVWRPGRWDAILDLLRLMQDEARGGRADAGIFAARLLDLLLMHLRRSKEPVREPAGAVLARKARTLIEHDPAAPLDHETVARRLGVSPEHLSRCLVRHLGAGSRALSSRMRRRQAEELLANRDLSITEVAATIGYTDVAAFCKAFRRWTGATAKAWRRQFVTR